MNINKELVVLLIVVMTVFAANYFSGVYTLLPVA